jgi:2-aminoethylphosphonate transport system permease protein
VVVGLGLLIAFNHPPAVLGGTWAVVIAAHATLVLAFTVGTVSVLLLLAIWRVRAREVVR